MSTATTIDKRDPGVPERMQQRPTVAPPVDVYENKEELLILADLPGVTKDDLALAFDKEQLTIEGRRPRAANDEEAFDYRRTFVLPRGIDADRITANLQNGVLRVVLPKPAALKPRQIEVKAG